jgi:hypothetical protein
MVTAIPAWGETLTLEIKPPAPPGQARYMGAGSGSTTPTDANRSPKYGTVGYDNLTLLRDGKPWLPVMGEFHFSRYPANEWRDELLKMKAGGVTIVSSYVFWIHHEEVRGQWDWSGQRSLRDFVRTCGEVGMPVIVRMGPWCHGEARNGGMPDWADAMPRKRSTDEAFLAAVRPLYQQIAEQLKGQLWKDGGPVLGVQVDNEYGGAPAYLLALKQMARDAGIDVPIYTRTGWPAPRSPYPYGELLPLFGAYAEGFWDRSLDPMPGNYWQAFTFSTERVDTAIATDIFGQRAATQSADAGAESLTYPYLTCELGGGMETSYHRRITIHPMDVLSIPLTKVGSGLNLPGYYMYHGGTNPEGKTTDMMQETQSRKMANDLPYKSYDWQSPLGEFGQARESYHLLRRFHLFLKDFGPELAWMTPTFPPIENAKDNTTDLRYAVRSDGKSGFLFINNYQRGLDMPAKPETRFQFKMPGGTTVQIPQDTALTVPANSSFLLPFNLSLGAPGATLAYATAQPVCRIADGDVLYTIFTQVPGLPAEFALPKGTLKVPDVAKTTQVVNTDTLTILRNANPNGGAAVFTTAEGKKLGIVLLDDKTSAHVWKGSLAGTEHLFTTTGNLVTDGNALRLTGRKPADFQINAIPPLRAQARGGVPQLPTLAATFEQVQSPGPLRTIKTQKVTEGPTSEDFTGDQPAVFQVKLPAALASLDKNTRVLMRLHYAGDVARIYLGDRLLADDFYNGDTFEFGLWRYPELTETGGGTLIVKILPLQKNAPILLAKWPDMGGKESIATLEKVELLPEATITLEAR